MSGLVSSALARLGDAGMCLLMNAVQARHRPSPQAGDELEQYVSQWEGKSPEEFYAVEQGSIPSLDRKAPTMDWQSPIQSGHAANDRVHVDLFPCKQGWEAPTVLLLHALMSASDTGYRAWASRFNARGWNACFIHLPYHYSRKPQGYLNGELAITGDLVRTGEGLRQGVRELRQLMAALRNAGCREFGLWATSYGAWIGALLSWMERDFRFITLMTPIADVHHAIWQSPVSRTLRRHLKISGISPTLVARHFALIEPLRRLPLDPADRVRVMAGRHDQIVLTSHVRLLAEAWPGARYSEWDQGHFGYVLMREAFAELEGVL